MNIFLHTGPLESGHRVRGIGSYTRSLLQGLSNDASITVTSGNQIDTAVDCDIIHYPFFDLFQRTLKVHPTIPTIVTVHDVIPLLFPKQFPIGVRGSFSFHWQKRALKKASVICTDSRASYKCLVLIKT
jgi:hypothetical protein